MNIGCGFLASQIPCIEFHFCSRQVSSTDVLVNIWYCILEKFPEQIIESLKYERSYASKNKFK